jgi:GLPGLI family protein
MMAETKLGKMAMPPEKETVRESVTKYHNSDQILYTTFIMYDKYKVKQDIKLQWKLQNEFSKILNYNVQKATTEFGGRQWTAWFSKDLPIQDGPHKFKGLPGLILKLEDSHQNHIFELKGIRSGNDPFIYPDLKQYREFEMNYSQFVKKFKNYRKNPAADLVGRIPDQRDANGTLRTSDEIIREINKISLERLAKDNNLIEIDLLK